MKSSRPYHFTIGCHRAYLLIRRSNGIAFRSSPAFGSRTPWIWGLQVLALLGLAVGSAAAAATITLRRIARSVVVSFLRHPTGHRFQFTEEDSPWQSSAVQRRFVSLFLG